MGSGGCDCSRESRSVGHHVCVQCGCGNCVQRVTRSGSQWWRGIRVAVLYTHNVSSLKKKLHTSYRRQRVHHMKSTGSVGASPARVLSIAGSDSGGGAGLQADLKTLTAHGVYGGSVVTAVTAQNTLGVQAVHSIPPAFVREQLQSVLADMKFRVVKTGMLPNAGTVRVVAEAMREFGITRVIVDPVMVATSGDALAGGSDWLRAIREELIPISYVCTPNIAEASAIIGRDICTERDVRDACIAIRNMGARFVLVKGGHALSGDVHGVAEELQSDSVATDVLYDGMRFFAFSKPRLTCPNTHGTGCTLASAIAAQVAMGRSVHTAVEEAKGYVFDAIRNGFAAGAGCGVLNHMHGIERAGGSKGVGS